MIKTSTHRTSAGLPKIRNNQNGYLWQFIGDSGTIRIASNTGRRRLNIIGAINPETLGLTSLLCEGKCDREVMKVFLEQIRNDYTEAGKITVFLDNASYNRAYDVKDKAESLGIHLKHLPPYSPNLNLIERLWKFFKKKVIKNNYYPTFDFFYQAVVDFLKNFPTYIPELQSLLTLNFEVIKAI